jgi:hypothetical protein
MRALAELSALYGRCLYTSEYVAVYIHSRVEHVLASLYALSEDAIVHALTDPGTADRYWSRLPSSPLE